MNEPISAKVEPSKEDRVIISFKWPVKTGAQDVACTTYFDDYNLRIFGKDANKIFCKFDETFTKLSVYLSDEARIFKNSIYITFKAFSIGTSHPYG